MSETPTPKPQPVSFKDWRSANREFEENERVRKAQEDARIRKEIDNSAGRYLERFWVAARAGQPVLSGNGFFIAADEDSKIFRAIERKLKDLGWSCKILTGVRTELWVVP